MCFGGEPRALAMSTGRCLRDISTCDWATEWSHPITPALCSASSPSGGTPRSSRTRETNDLCSSGIIAAMSSGLPSVGTLLGMTMSTP